jgi:hypothetical protein
MVADDKFDRGGGRKRKMEDKRAHDGNNNAQSAFFTLTDKILTYQDFRSKNKNLSILSIV